MREYQPEPVIFARCLSSVLTTIAPGSSVTGTGNAVSTPEAASTAYTVVTTGYIDGKATNGIAVGAGGAVTNLAGGRVIGGAYGIYIATDAGTITNGGAVVTMYPDFAAARWDAFGYAPLTITGPEVDATPARLAGP